MPKKSDKQSKSAQIKYVGKKKVLTRAEFETKQTSDIKGGPLEVSRMMPGAKTTEQEPKKAPPAEGQKDQPPVDEFNPMENEPEKSPQDEETKEETPQASEGESPQEEVEEENAEEEEQAEKEEAEQETEEENPEDGLKEQAKDEVKQKIQQQIKERAKKFIQNLAKKFSKEALKAAASAIWAFIVAFWPYILAVAVILFIIFIIAASCSKQGGKTPTQPLNKTTDKKLVLQFLAAGKDKSAQRELIADEAISIKDNLKKISTDNADAQAKIDQINQLLDEIVALSDSDAAVLEKIKQLLLLLDDLKKILPDQAALIDQIKNQIIGIQKMIEFYQNGHLVVNPKDMDYVRNYEADRRLIQMLVYLITPEDQGGAGHERLRVKRIRFSYDTERKSVSKETDYSEKDEPNVSAHYTGQAADITEIDCIKCTQIKRRRLRSDKKTKLDPIHINVAWQSEEGYLKAGGPDAYGQNMHQVFNNLANGAIDEMLVGELSDIFGVELDPEKIKGRSFPEIARYIGQAVIKESLDIPGDYELGNNLEDIANNVGRAYLAKAIDAPLDGIRGGSPDELMENIGRAITEERMHLPPGSLEGANSGELFASVGRRMMEKSLNLSRGSLSPPYQGGDIFLKILGQGRTEASLGLKPQTFHGESIEEAKTKIGKEAFNTTFANPEVIDNWLGISTGTTEKLINDQISPNSYNRLVGYEVFDRELGVYEKIEKRAEAFGITESDMLKFITTSDVFVSIGQTTIAKTLTVSDEEQALLKQWFYAKQKSSELDEDYLAGQYGLKEEDLGKIFVDDLTKEVFKRVGQVETLNRLSANPKLSSFLEPVQDFQFYNDRLHLIKDDLEYLESKSPSQEVRNKATETKNLINGLLGASSISDIRKSIKQIQVNVKFMEENGGSQDPKSAEKIKEIKKAINEIIEGKEIQDFDTVSPDTMTAKTDPQVKLTKKDIYGLLTGKKKVDDLVYAIGLRKWEIELDLPDESLADAYREMKNNNFSNPDDTLLISIGKAKIKERGGIRGDSEQIDRNLNLPLGTTADYRSGKITENAFYKKVGMGVTNNIAANLINRQLDLTDDPNYALNGGDITNLLNGGWFYVVLKVAGRGIDEALDFPAGGTIDIVNQISEVDDPIDALAMLAERKLGQIAGLDRAVSLSGDIPYNLGRVKIELELGLKPNEINDNNLVEKIKDYTNSNNDNLSRLDMTFGLEPWTSQAFIGGAFISSHDYIIKVGNFIRDSVIYDRIARYAPFLKDQDVRSVVLALAEQTGTPQDILEAAGARQVGDVLGLDYPVSIRGNFKDNLGQAKIEDRLGLLRGSFIENLDMASFLNGQEKFESAFYIGRGELDNARNADSGYWDDARKNQAKIVDAILNIRTDSTKDFITGTVSLPDYVDRVGQSSMLEITAEKLIDLLDLEDKYQYAATELIAVIQSDPSLSNPDTQKGLFYALQRIGGVNLDNETKFDPGTWEKILWVDPEDPEHTGLRNASYVILEQGKKWLPRWIGFSQEQEDKYGNWIDIIYEQGLEWWGPAGLYNEQTMVNAIQGVTGIPDAHDAKRFLNGDIKGALTSLGAAAIVTYYNKEFGDQGFTIDYATVKKAYFNDPAGEQAIGDAAVEKANQELAGIGALSATAQQTIREEAIRESRDNAKKDLQYQVVDMQLHKWDENIPAGFAKAMREGNSEEKWNMGFTYIGNMVHSKNPEIPVEILPDLERYFNPDSPQYHDLEAISDTSYAFLDNKMQTKWFGDWVQPGTAKALFEFGKTGKLGSIHDEGTLTKIYYDHGINVVTNWADKELNLPSGTTKMAYDYFTKYQKAREVYKAAQIANAAQETVETAAALAESEAALNGLKADAITFVITFAFQKQLYAMDQKLGLVPGSSAMLVGIGIDLLITGAANPVAVAIFVVTNLFGTYRIDVVCTACGYYPAGHSRTGLFVGFALTTEETIYENQNPTCPLGEFDGTSEDAFKTNAIAAAQWKVNQLINDVLEMSQKLNDDNLTPTQIMTYSQEDVESLASTLNDLYGPASTRMNSGLWANELMWDHIHIGY